MTDTSVFEKFGRMVEETLEMRRKECSHSGWGKLLNHDGSFYVQCLWCDWRPWDEAFVEAT